MSLQSIAFLSNIEENNHFSIQASHIKEVGNGLANILSQLTSVIIQPEMTS